MDDAHDSPSKPAADSEPASVPEQPDPAPPHGPTGNPEAPRTGAETGADGAGPASEPAAVQVYDYLLYGLSVPERALRATSAVVGGALSESASLLVPQAFRSSKSYDVFVQQMLDFMVRDMGGVVDPQADPEKAPEVEGYVARKTVGSFVDLAGLATLHLSPLTVMAIVSDVAYGSTAYLKELSDELKEAGVIDADTTIDHASDLLDALGQTSSGLAASLDTPPLSVEGLRETIEQTQQSVGRLDVTKLIPRAEMQQLWDEMHEIARQEDVSLMEVSSAMTLYSLNQVRTVSHGALSSVRVAGNMFDRHIFDHYRDGAQQIREQGFYTMLSKASGPYIAAVWENFSSGRTTVTEDLVTGRLIGRAWKSVRGWFGSRRDAPSDTPPPEEPSS